jgi:MraZ protein
MLFSGAYSHTVDNKGRTVIPSRFRTKLGERFYITRGMHGCLWVFSDEAWRDFQKMVTPKSLLDGNGLKLERFFVGSAVECAPDGQGRIFVPQSLRDYAGIKDDIWVVGLGNKVEIWSDAKWQEFNNALTDDVIEQLGADLQKQDQVLA